MKDSEFIDLLNLYLDHEITAADAVRLEAEVQANPNRRRTYQEYCRMQKACKMLAQDFATETDAPADRKVVAFDSAAQPSGRGWTLGALTAVAAAACVALFVGHARRSAPAAPATSPVAQATTAPSEPAQQVAATTPSRGIERRAANPFALSTGSNALALGSVRAQDPNFAWLEQVRLSPLQTPAATSLRLNSTPLRAENGTFNSDGKPVSNDSPLSIAVRFQK